MTSGADQLLDRAIKLHKAGDLAGSIEGYQKVLEQAPRHAGALNLLGLAYFQSGRGEEAISPLQEALALRPDLPGADFNLGIVLYALKRYAKSVPHFEKAVALNPGDFQAHFNLASAQMALDNHASATAHFEKTVALRPDYTPAYVNLGKLALVAKDFGRAAAHFRSALARDPKLLDAYFGLAQALRASKLAQELLSVCEKAVALAPENAEAHWWYGIVLYDAGRISKAVEQHQNAIALAPDFAMAHYGLGTSYYALNQYDLACQHFQRALALNLSPDNAILAEHMMALAMHARGRYEEADQVFDRIIARHGDGPHGLEAKKSKGMLYLNLGKFTEGWPLYDYRLGADAPNIRDNQRPRWKGDGLDGTLWVWAEQGLGDQILHAGMIDELRSRAASIVLEVEPRLVDLFARSFPGIRVVPFNSDLSGQEIGAQTSIANLGGYLRPDWASFPRRESGYLVADPERTAELRSRLANDGRKIIGISWRSISPRFGRNKSAQLGDFLKPLEQPGIHAVDLQYGETAEERAAFERTTGIAVTRLEDIDNTNDIDGLAALMCACDAVVTVSNTTAHLAGALGRPTWVFVPFGFSQMWYWFAGKTQSPWYPRVQVRHQTEHQSWKSLISSTAADIAEAIATIE